MRKVNRAAFFIAAFAMLMGFASVPMAFGADDALDAAIRELSDYLNRRIPQGSKAVFLNVKSDWPAFSEYILDSLQENAVNDDVFSVVDRRQLDAIRSELNFQWSGEVSNASAQEIGQMLGAQTIVSGSITTVGSEYRIQVRAILVQTAAVQGLTTKSVSSKGPVVTALTTASAATAVSSGGRTSAGTQAAQPDPAAYRIGDTGPAGGIVFYDKGNYNGDWRYLEAAPANTDKEPAMFAADKAFGDVKDRRLGAGKENTIMLMEILNRKGGSVNTAPWICNQLEINGFNDWYQPSLDELLTLYKNIYGKNGSGGFKPVKYWSSTFSSNGGVYTVNFSNGKDGFLFLNERTLVRAVRRF